MVTIKSFIFYLSGHLHGTESNLCKSSLKTLKLPFHEDQDVLCAVDEKKTTLCTLCTLRSAPSETW